MGNAPCVAVSEAWDIVELLVHCTECSEAVAAAQRVVGEREQAAAPALNALNAAAKSLRRALMATASKKLYAFAVAIPRRVETQRGFIAERESHSKELQASIGSIRHSLTGPPARPLSCARSWSTGPGP